MHVLYEICEHTFDFALESNVNISCITDAKAPTIVCGGDHSVKAEEGRSSAVVVWKDPAVSYNSGGILQVSCDPKSGTSFTIGQTTVICEAVDYSGNKAVCSFRVNVTGSCSMLFKTDQLGTLL